MSPEQAMGEREITARSDVYALGAVLYEMLTGDPPFTGSTAQAVVARVVTESPRPLVPQRHTIPPHVEAAVLTALEKLPADRFASAAEFAEALEGQDVSVDGGDGRGGGGRGRAGARRAHGRRRLVLAGALVLATAAALWGWLRPSAGAAAHPVQPGPPHEPDAAGAARDRRRADRAVARRAVAGLQRPRGRREPSLGPPVRPARRLADRGHRRGRDPFFSPDGERVGFVKGGTAIRIASLAGAPTVTLSEKVNTTGGDWASDGYIYFEVDSGLARMRASGGDIEPVYTIKPDKKEVATEWPQRAARQHRRDLPDAPHRPGRLADFEIMAAPLPPKPHEPARTLVRGVYAAYAPSGHLLVVTSDGKLIAIPFDPKKLALTGAPIALLEGVGVRNGGFNVDLTLADNGTLAYTTGGTLVSRRAVWVSMEGGVTPVDPGWDPQGVIESASLAPDGKSAAIGLSRDGRRDIWVKQLPDGPFSRITFGDTSSVRPAWSPDGREVYYVNDRAGSGVGPAYAHRADGTGAARLIKSSPQDDYGQVALSRDGKWLLLRTAPVGAGSADILGMHLPDTTLVPLVTTSAAELHPALSPDGRWLAYSSNESGTFEVYVRPFPETSSAKWQVSTAGGAEPAWSKDARRLFYINGRNEMVSVEITAVPTFTVGKQRPLFTVAQFTRTGPIPSFSLAPDGEHFLMVREGESTQQSELIVAENWLETLRGK